MLSTIIKPPDLAQACHGLVGSANRPAVGDDRWQNGIKFTPRGCYPLGAQEVACPPEEKDALLECAPAVEIKPYVVTVGLDWSANSPEDPKEVALQALEFGLSAKLEDLIWNGVAGGTNPTLADGDSVSGATDMATAFAAIEAAFLGGGSSATITGGAGTIYASPTAIVQAGNAVYESGGRLYTKATCSLVVVGNFPTDSVAGHLGGVDLYLGDPYIADSRDEYRSNEYDLMAEVLALVVWNPCGVFLSGVPGPG